jgi:hypothetical protein
MIFTHFGSTRIMARQLGSHRDLILTNEDRFASFIALSPDHGSLLFVEDAALYQMTVTGTHKHLLVPDFDYVFEAWDGERLIFSRDYVTFYQYRQGRIEPRFSLPEGGLYIGQSKQTRLVGNWLLVCVDTVSEGFKFLWKYNLRTETSMPLFANPSGIETIVARCRNNRKVYVTRSQESYSSYIPNEHYLIGVDIENQDEMHFSKIHGLASYYGQYGESLLLETSNNGLFLITDNSGEITFLDLPTIFRFLDGVDALSKRWRCVQTTHYTAILDCQTWSLTPCTVSPDANFVAWSDNQEWIVQYHSGNPQDDRQIKALLHRHDPTQLIEVNIVNHHFIRWIPNCDWFMYLSFETHHLHAYHAPTGLNQQIMWGGRFTEIHGFYPV